jgi:hypothetical protein
LFTVTNFVHATVTVLDDSAIWFDDVRTFDLNMIDDISSTRVSSAETRYAEIPKEFVPPAPLREPEGVTLLTEFTTTSLETASRFEDLRTTTEAAVGTVRIVYLVRVLANGRESDLLLLADDALSDVTKLFEEFREYGLPNGRYRIYLKEIGLPARRVIEFYKSGEAFGDPLHEPGPGSNPVPRNTPAPPPQGDGAAAASESQHVATEERHDGGPLVKRSDRGDWAALGERPERLVRPILGRLTASLEALVPNRGNADWSQRVDQALENAPQDALGSGMRWRKQVSDSTDRRFRS